MEEDGTTNVGDLNLIDSGTDVSGEVWIDNEFSNLDVLVIELESGSKYYVAYKFAQF